LSVAPTELDSAQRTRHDKVFESGHFVLHGTAVAYKGQRLKVRLSLRVDAFPVPENVASRRKQQPAEEFEQTRLTAAIGASHFQAVTGPYEKIQIAEQPAPPPDALEGARF
jgi:hypothetical protein